MNREWADPTVMSLDHRPKDYLKVDHRQQRM